MMVKVGISQGGQVGYILDFHPGSPGSIAARAKLSSMTSSVPYN